MKRTVTVATLASSSVILVLTLIGCQPAAAPTPAPAANANTQPAKPLDTAAIEKELLQLEREWSTAFVSRNVEAVKKIEADDFSLIYPDGTTGTKADDVRDIESGALSAQGWELTEVKVRVLDADTAVVTGIGIVKNGKYKGPDGRVTEIKPYRFTDVFRRRNGQWQVVSSQSTNMVNPPAAASTSPSAAK
jgi:hypothetical protein